MTIPGSANPLLLASTASAQYTISRSLRFNSSDSGFCARTPSSAGNRRTFTWSGWVKLGTNFASRRMLFGGGTVANSIPNTYLEITDSAQLGFDSVDPPSLTNVARVRTTAVLRDPSAWYHILFSVDTTQSTAANRVKIYINGVEQTSYSSTTYPSQNYDCGINSTQVQTIGAYPEAAYRSGLYFDGYIADCIFVDGSALTPSSFTEVSATTGQLLPRQYTGSFGTNGFWLKFSDNSNNTATTLGKDYSPNGNNWTPTNFSVAAGAGNDSLVDTPTSYGTDTGAGGEVRGNYCTMNPLDAASGAALTLTNGNLEHTNPSTNWRWRRGTFAMTTGKWYWEQTVSDGATASTGYLAGVATSSFDFNVGTAGLYARQSSTQYNNGSSSTPFSTTNAGDVLGFAFDADAGKLWVSQNGTFVGSPTAGTGNSWSNVPSGVFPLFAAYNVAGNIMNFGQRPFAYTAPSGFKALCDTNLPAPVVAKPNTVMDVKLYTGNGSTNTISGLGFSPDLLWFKSRSTGGAGYSNIVFDTVRGSSKSIATDRTDSEYTGTDLTSFNSDGFTLAAVNQWFGVNNNGTTFVAWAWDAGSSTVTNTQGSITSSVRANASAGFSIVTYTGTGANATIGHGLGVAPSFVVVKSRTTPSTTGHWFCYHSELGNTKAIFLNLTNAAGTSSTYWNNTSPTSTVFSISTEPAINQSTITYVAYCFAPVAGYSSFGSYTGNGSTDGPFVYTGFRPRWILLKRSSHVGGWTIYDAARDTYNVASKYLIPDLSDAEYTFASVDLLSNGFKLRENAVGNNTSGYTIIYAAFAESPFQYARAR